VPVVQCPKCPTKLKIPDGASGNTKCPKCATVFAVGAPKPAFEVVEDDAPPSKPAAPKVAPKPAPAAKPKSEEPEFEVVDDAPAKKKAKAKSDDSDDDMTVEIVEFDEHGNVLSRSTMTTSSKKNKKSRDDDDDDDDDEDDRPRKKKKKKKRSGGDDDGFPEWKPTSKSAGAFRTAKTGARLASIAFWLNCSAYALIALYMFIAFIMVNTSSSMGLGGMGEDTATVLMVLPGLLGTGGWVLGIVGFGMMCAGPQKARGTCIAATIMAVIHLTLMIIIFTNAGKGMPFVGRGMLGDPRWMFMSGTMGILEAVPAILIYGARVFKDGDFLLLLFAAIFEVLRHVVGMFAVKATAEAARDGDAGHRATMGALSLGATLGLGALVLTLLIVIMEMAKGGRISPFFKIVILTYAGFAWSMFHAASAASATRDACARRS
jgi:hypothetical protein